MDSFSFILTAHIIGGAMLAMTLVIMQLVILPGIGKISEAKEKKVMVSMIQGRWHPVIDVVIIIMILSGIYLLITRWSMIGASHWLHVKVSFGFFALASAASLHFYFKQLKKKLAANGETERLKKIQRRTLIIEKITLVSAAITFLMGIFFSHLL